jgi:hypothetical protein
MVETTPPVGLRSLVAAWSDAKQQDAVKLAEESRGLMGFPIGSSQLAGLNNIVQSATSSRDIKEFIQNQGRKAERAGRDPVKGFWDSVGKALAGLDKEAYALAERAGLPVPPKDAKAKVLAKELDWLVLALAREYVQHLVAHSLFLGRRS